MEEHHCILPSVLPSCLVAVYCIAKQSRLGTGFPDGLRGGDGGELNSPSKQTHRKMYYRLSRCFFLTLQTPIDGILQRWPSGLR
jgi:hypothetical protein